jgi:hypothetical protein
MRLGQQLTHAGSCFKIAGFNLGARSTIDTNSFHINLRKGFFLFKKLYAKIRFSFRIFELQFKNLEK